MKIVHLEVGRHLNGGAAQVAGLVNALTEFENVLVCRPQAAIVEVVASHVRVVEVPLHGDLDIRAKAKLRNVLEQESPDLLHVHSRAGADRYGGRAARALGVPTVLTRRVDNPEPRLWARRKFSSYDAIAAISSPIEHWLREDVRVPAQRVTRIASGVDPDKFATRDIARAELLRRFDIYGNRPIIGAAGQLIERKGYDVLLDALPTVIARHRDLKLILFGRGPKMAALSAQARRLGITDHVVFAGFVSGLESLLAGFDAFVHPARTEGLGLVVLEALAAGVPVVACRAGGLVDAIEDGRNGILAQPDDAPALTSALLRMLEDPIAAGRLAAEGRREVTARFSLQEMVDGYRALYSDLLRESR